MYKAAQALPNQSKSESEQKAEQSECRDEIPVLEEVMSNSVFEGSHIGHSKLHMDSDEQ